MKRCSFAHKSFHEFLAAEAFQYRTQGNDELRKLLNDEQNRDWWREVLLFRMNMMKIGELADFIGLSVMQPLDSINTDQLANHAGLIALCAQAATEAKLDEHALHAYDPGLLTLFQMFQDKLQKLMEHEKLSITQRAVCGYWLGRLGDYREGVGVVRSTERAPLFSEIGEIRHKVPDIKWIEIPGGRFKMGCGTDDETANSSEKPEHDVEVSPFCMSRYPITNAQYGCFIEAGGYQNEAYWRHPSTALEWWKGEKADLSPLDDNTEIKKAYESWLAQDKTRRLPWFWDQAKWNNPNHPIVGVSWYEVLAFCKWLEPCLRQEAVPKQHRISGKPRLPSEDEWEYAARGKQGLIYPWGTEADPSLGNYRESGIESTSAVGLFPTGKAFGPNQDLYDMSGNVWEWTSSRWGKSLSKPDFKYSNWNQDDTLRNDLEAMELRVIRGGSWGGDPGSLRCAARHWIHPDFRGDNVGFRVVFSLAAES